MVAFIDLMETAMRKFAPPDDGRGIYVEFIQTRAPRGTAERVKEAAERERVSVAEFMRRAIAERLEVISGHADEVRDEAAA